MPNPGLSYKIAELIASSAVSSFPTAAAPASNASLGAVMRDTWDAVRNGTGGTEPGTNKSVIDAIGATGAAYVDTAGSLYYSTLAQPRCVAKTDGAVSDTADPLFTISGGPIRCRIYGIVTTTLEASASAGKLTITTVSPAATVDMSAAGVELNGDVAGTSYRHINTTAILTPVTAGFVMMGNAFATQDVEFFCPIGTINFIAVAALTGVIAWYCEYVPLSPLSRVVAAA